MRLRVVEWINVASPLHRRTALSTNLLWCALVGCTSACMAGGQSGDDGDAHGGGPALDPGVDSPVGMPEPENGCEEESRPLEPTDSTVFGLTPTKLLEGIAPPTAPFHWVNFSSSNLDVSHHPGPSETSLNLELSLRDAAQDLDSGEAILEAGPEPASDAGAQPCLGPRVHIPVWVSMSTSDGALKARVRGTLTFYGRQVAELTSRFVPAELEGALEFAPFDVKTPDTEWTLHALNLFASLWDGGSAGAIRPEFVLSTQGTMGSGGAAASPPPATPPPSGVLDQIAIPEQHDAIGLWPRLEQCPQGVVRAVDDRVLGFSARDILNALNAEQTYPLEVTTNQTDLVTSALPLSMTAQLPEPLVCVTLDHTTATLSLTVPATLRAEPEALPALSTDLSLALRATADPTAGQTTWQSIYFERSLADAVHDVSPSAVAADPGIPLDGVSTEYTRFWWTWFGHVEPASRAATFVLTSPNSAQTASVAELAAQGGPDFGIAVEPLAQVLPGDVLFEATLR